MIKLNIIVATGLALALAACSQEEAATPESPPAAEPVPATTEAAPATTGEPAPATAPADVQSTSGSGVTATNSDGTDLQASSAYDQGCAAGAEDANVNMSMAYERHNGEYDSQYEDTFRAGYEKCWTENRQEAQQAPPPEANDAATNSDGTDLQASSAYDQGCAAGAEDANMNMSMAHERHSGEYDSQYEDTFRAGYEKCWTENRQ